MESNVDPDTLRRARTRFATFGIEQVAAALLDLRSEKEIDVAVIRAAQWVRRTCSGRSSIQSVWAQRTRTVR